MKMTEKKRIGIVTFHNTLDNYGQVLQYLATQEYLEKRGHEVYLYQSLGHKVSVIKRIKRIIKKLVKPLFLISQNKKNDSAQPIARTTNEEESKHQIFQRWGEITQQTEKIHPRNFDKFRKRYFHVIKRYYEDTEGFYAFAIGSDQMWSYVSEETMLDFVPNNSRRFSLAPSVGHKKFSADEISYASESIKKFDFITVREVSGLDFCRACGRDDAQLVLDPTFLLKKEVYDKYADAQYYKYPQRYILLYLLGGEIQLEVGEIITWAKDNDLEVVYVASQGRDDDYPKCYASVEQWLYALKNATYIFTNSYHGMALSIIYRKPFLVFPLLGIMEGMNGRINNLANLFSLHDRIYKGVLSAVKDPINWSKTDLKVEGNFMQIDALLQTIQL